jgi:hypothetical protein
MKQFGLVQKFHSILPAVREWIQMILAEYQGVSFHTVDFAFPRLSKVFPRELLIRTKVVVTSGRIPFPPLSDMGLSEFGEMENMAVDGITFVDTYFIHHRSQSETLHFHELVHVVQWARLGIDRYLLAYGAGLMKFGYLDSPLEKMAYSLQSGFEKGDLPPNAIEWIQHETDAVWNGVAPLFPGT